MTAAIAAIAACGLGITPAAAAVTGPAAPAAVFGSAQGTHCTTIKSPAPVRFGVICVGVVERGPLWRAEVSFEVGTGRLREVSVRNLRLMVAGSVKERTGRVLKGATGKTSVVPSNWFDDDLLHVYGRGSVINACVVWADGARACTGNYWFYSQRVRF
ncbi:MAG TPA: hypothetical protein VMF87_29065 [Streptosporangiaceae bacterium]|nr:hypothetical protein [Streptosporangiaceae bacterium]